MSVTAIFIAALHGIPVFLAATFTRNRLTTTVVALLMAVVAVAFGRSAYNFIDLAAVGIVYFLCISARPAG